MHPRAIAEEAPDRPAIVMAGDGAVTTFAELDARSNQFAQFLRARGVEQRGSVSLFAENHPRFLEVMWGAQRAGLYYTAVNSHLNADDAGYIVDDCDAAVFVSTRQLAPVATRIDATLAPKVHSRLLLGGSAMAGRTTRTSSGRSPPIRSLTKPRASSCSTRPARPGGRRASSAKR